MNGYKTVVIDFLDVLQGDVCHGSRGEMEEPEGV